MDRSKLKNKTNKSKDPNDIASYRKQHNLVVSLKTQILPMSTKVVYQKNIKFGQHYGY